MNILMTGSDGFVGKALFDRLCGKHHVGLYDIKNGMDTRVLKDLVELPDPYDMIIHLAAEVGAAGSNEKIYDYHSSNVYGTMNVCEYARQMGIPYMIHFSSCSVYGNTTESPIIESTPFSPFNPYGRSKVAAESIVESYRESAGLQVALLRPTFIYGPGQREYTIANEFSDCAINNKPLVIYGKGEQRKGMNYISDIVDLVEVMIDKKPDDNYVVTGPDTLSINEMAQVIQQINSKCKIKHIKKPVYNYDQIVDATKVTKKMRWHPKISIRDGFLRTIEWKRQQKNN